MKFFNRQEVIVISLIVLFIFSLSFFNFRISLRRARDAQRKQDLGDIYNALNKYHKDFGFFPPASEKGEIIACKGVNYQEVVDKLEGQVEFDLEEYFKGLRPCIWGQDEFRDISDEDYEPYTSVLPSDPLQNEGISYFYTSNLKRFQVYAYLEGESDEVGYNKQIVKRGLMCGSQNCSFGRAFGSTPLEKSLQEYENELLEKK